MAVPPVLLPHLHVHLRMAPVLQIRIRSAVTWRQTHQNAKILAAAIHKAQKLLNRKIQLIASSDFSHYVDPSEGKQLDKLVVDEIMKLNTTGIQNAVVKNSISVCGYGPIMTLMEYAKLITPKPIPKILKQGHSGEVIPSSEVVDYISILFYED